MSIMDYNGGCVVAMVGKNCVAIATDLRFGVQTSLIQKRFQRVFQVGPKLFVGLPGLATDTQTVLQRLTFRIKMYEMREGRPVQPRVLMAMIQNLLYERRFGPYFVSPIVAGLDENNKPFICSFDLIGCSTEPEDFVTAGTCEESLYGMCETLWKPDLGPNELFEIISQSLLSAADRDAISGMGAVVRIIEADKTTIKEVKGRMD